jgi:uncharacterized repeat protein (TIGR03803 family)
VNFRIRTFGLATCCGILMAARAEASSFTTILSLDGTYGAEPNAIVPLNGQLYLGVDVDNGYGGEVLQLDPATGKHNILHVFEGPDGGGPISLLPGPLSGGQTLYGSTLDGGAGYNTNGGGGVLFSLGIPSKEEATTYNFMFGAEGAEPYNTLRYHNTWYGTLLVGASSNTNGGIYRYNGKTKRESVVYSFAGGADGRLPNTLALMGKNLVGTTVQGGAGYGVVFTIDLATLHESTLYSFGGGTDGGAPGSVIPGGKNILYGTTTNATPPGNGGTVFSFNTKGGKFKTLYNFVAATDGAGPAHLIRVDNILYGICLSGGPAQAGTVFQIDVNTGQETTLHQFTGGADGKQPASLVYTNGMLFGTTTYGGTGAGYGTVFKITF